MDELCTNCGSDNIVEQESLDGEWIDILCQDCGVGESVRI